MDDEKPYQMDVRKYNVTVALAVYVMKATTEVKSTIFNKLSNILQKKTKNPS